MGKHLLNLPYLTAKTAKGHQYFYYRRGGKWWPLPCPTDPQFKERYDAIHSTFTLSRNPAKRGTVSWLVEQFKGSAEFKTKHSSTRKDYATIADKLCKVWGDIPINNITRAAVFAYRDRLADRPRTANYHIQVLRLLLNFAVDRSWLVSNPASRPKRLKTGPGHQPWPVEAIQKFREANADYGTMLLALTLGLCTAQRQGDILKMRMNDFNDGLVRTVQSKTGNEVWIPQHPSLRAALSAVKGRYMVLVTKTGRSYKGDHFRHEWRAATLRAGLDGLTFHGLRTTAGTFLAEAGCSDAELQSILGHTTQSQSAHYRRKASSKTMAVAGMAKLEQSKPDL
jgi:integrase